MKQLGQWKRSKAALICQGSLPEWLKIMQLLFYKSLSSKPIHFLTSSLAAVHFLKKFPVVLECWQMHIFPGGAAGAQARAILVLVVNTRACRETSRTPRATALRRSKGARVKVFKVSKVSWVNWGFWVNEERKQPSCVKKFLFVLWICNVST